MMAPSNCRQRVCFVLVMQISLISRVYAGAAQAPLRQPGPGDHLATQLSPKLTSALWKSRITVPKETPQQTREKNKLARLIQRVQSTRIVIGAKKVVTSDPVTATVSASEPIDLSPRVDVNRAAPNEPAMSAVVAAAAPEPQYNLKDMLQQMSGKQDTIENPFELAEVLRSSGHLKQAADYYQVALGRAQANTPRGARRRAWMLFQMGCCLRTSDPAGSKRFYQQLLDEYPNSPWSESAQSLLALVSWYDAEKPVELIGQCMYGNSGK
jgi:hypothetical protein